MSSSKQAAHIDESVHLGVPLSLADRMARARDYWARFAALLHTDSVGYPSDLRNLRCLYANLNRAMPSDVEQAILRPDSSLRGLAFWRLMRSRR